MSDPTIPEMTPEAVAAHLEGASAASPVESAPAPAVDQHTGTQVYVDGRELSKEEVDAMDARIEKVRAGVGRTLVDATPDPVEVAGREREELRGRDVSDFDSWRKVMEKWGFNWIEAEQLTRRFGLKPYIPSRIVGLAGETIHDEFGRQVVNTNLWWVKGYEGGQWRSDMGSRRPPLDLLRGKEMAFTMSDLILGYPGGPAEFDRFARGRLVQAEKARVRERALSEIRNRRGRRLAAALSRR